MSREDQIKWLENVKAGIDRLRDILEEETDVNLPRGFALGKMNEVTHLLNKCVAKVRWAIDERRRVCNE